MSPDPAFSTHRSRLCPQVYGRGPGWGNSGATFWLIFSPDGRFLVGFHTPSQFTNWNLQTSGRIGAAHFEPHERDEQRRVSSKHSMDGVRLSIKLEVNFVPPKPGSSPPTTLSLEHTDIPMRSQKDALPRRFGLVATISGSLLSGRVQSPYGKPALPQYTHWQRSSLYLSQMIFVVQVNSCSFLLSPDSPSTLKGKTWYGMPQIPGSFSILYAGILQRKFLSPPTVVSPHVKTQRKISAYGGTPPLTTYSIRNWYRM